MEYYKIPWAKTKGKLAFGDDRTTNLLTKRLFIGCVQCFVYFLPIESKNELHVKLYEVLLSLKVAIDIL